MGLDPGQMVMPSGVAVDVNGDILVASQFFVHKFSSIDGKFLGRHGSMAGPSALNGSRGLAGIY